MTILEENLIGEEKSEMNQNRFISNFIQDNSTKEISIILLRNKYRNSFIRNFFPIYATYLILFFIQKFYLSTANNALYYWLILFEALISISVTQVIYNYILIQIFNNKRYAFQKRNIIGMFFGIPIITLFLLDPFFLTKIIFFDLYSGISLFFSIIVIIWWILSHMDFNNLNIK